ncbi:aspartate aminotransferase family protein [Kiloniella laminariae]|uniref:Acetylornithine aminotransferase n=1 Tax=Kiloniella laminariae TaxID=454162 RepID=A0ABT4LME1_9PROT|nr:aspartate aminotransferase family protein [Kiloniella laminariae]MCZ4282239.1 aspartate aminotransferase family protein [Kiloniella laminariae]
MSDAVMPTYARIDLAFERGEGPYLYTAENRRYLDFAGGIAVNSLGHSHPRLVAALEEQGRKLWHVSNLYRISGGERLAERLVEHTFADKVFFTNSGTEALEGAIKLARKYHSHNGQPQKYRIITCDSAFHGRTMTALSAAGNAKHLEGFGPQTPGFDHVAFGNLNELRAAITEETAAILVEPIQGEGGIRAASLDFLKGLRTVCDEFGLLLILDEVQCGNGRTGKFFAYEWAGITPDVLATAKGIGGGFPLGAFMATDKAAAGMKPGTHGSTYGGNPLAMAIGNAVLDVLLEEGFLEGVLEISGYARERFEGLVARYPMLFEEVRGSGLMLGLKCKILNSDVIVAMRAGGLLSVGAADNVIRLLPPLTIERAHVDEAIAILEDVSQKLAQAA